MSEKQKEFLVSYQFGGASWSLKIPADTIEEAQRRVRENETPERLAMIERANLRLRELFASPIGMKD